jgi:tetratricopeptide (TPR) repeat protein
LGSDSPDTETKGDSFMNKWLTLAAAFAVMGPTVFAQETPAAQQAEPAGAADFRTGTDAFNKKDMDGAITSFEKALAANPDLFGGHYYRGYAYKQKQNWVKCGDNFSQFLQKLGTREAPTEKTAATREAAGCYMNAKSYEKALPLLQKAAAAAPQDSDIQNALGLAALRADREPEAEAAFSKVIELKPEIPGPYYFAGMINFKQQQFDKAQPRLQKYLELEPSGQFASDAHFQIGSIIYRQVEQGGDRTTLFPVVKEHMSKFLEGRPDAPQAPDALYILGWIAAQEENNEVAKGYFERFLQLRSDGPQAEEARRFIAELTGQ